MLEIRTYLISDQLKNSLLELNQCLIANTRIADKIIDYFDHYQTKLSPIVVSITDPDGPESIEKMLLLMDEKVLYQPLEGKDISTSIIQVVKQSQGNISIMNSSQNFISPKTVTDKKTASIQTTWDKNGRLQIQPLMDEFFLQNGWENSWRTDIVDYYSEWCSFKTGTIYKIAEIIGEIFGEWQEETNDFSFPIDIIGKSAINSEIRELKICDPRLGNTENTIRVDSIDPTEQWQVTNQEQWLRLGAKVGIQIKDKKNFTRAFKQLVEVWMGNLLKFHVNQALASAFNGLEVNQEILRAVEHDSGNSTSIDKGSLYDWLIVSENEQALKYKLQALKTASGFIRVKATESCGFIREKTTKAVQTHSFLTKGITQGLPLVGLIAQTLDVNTTIARTVKNMSFEEYIVFDERLKDIKELQKWFDLDWWPSAGEKSTGDQWRELIDMIGVNERLTGGSDRSTSSVFSNSSRLFENSGAIWKRKWPNPGYHNLLDIQDAVDAFVNQLLLPVYLDCCERKGIDPNLKQAFYVLTKATQDGLSALELALTHTKGIKELYKFSVWWHENVQKINGEILVGDQQSWMPLFQPQAIGEVWAQPLCTAHELLQEGMEMNHCVGTYVPRCMWENSHIIALRGEENKPLSTLEVKVQSRNIIAVQNRGAYNREPTPLALKATDQLLTDLNQGNIEVDWFTIESALYERLSKRGKNDIVSRIGYECQKESSRDQAIKSWSGAIKHSHRNLTHQEWIEKLEIKERVNKALEEIQVISLSPFKL